MKRVGVISKKTVALAGALALSSCVASNAFALPASDSGALQDSVEIAVTAEAGTGVASGEGSSENESVDIPSYGWYLNEATGDWSYVVQRCFLFFESRRLLGAGWCHAVGLGIRFSK